MRVLFNLSASDNDLTPSILVFLLPSDCIRKRDNNIQLRSSIVSVSFTLSASDNDLAPSELISLPI